MMLLSPAPLLSHYLCKTCVHPMTIARPIAINTTHAIVALLNDTRIRSRNGRIREESGCTPHGTMNQPGYFAETASPPQLYYLNL